MQEFVSVDVALFPSVFEAFASAHRTGVGDLEKFLKDVRQSAMWNAEKCFSRIRKASFSGKT